MGRSYHGERNLFVEQLCKVCGDPHGPLLWLGPDEFKKLSETHKVHYELRHHDCWSGNCERGDRMFVIIKESNLCYDCTRRSKPLFSR